MKIISKSQFKPQALEHMRWVERTGKSLIISDRGRPALELRPYHEQQPDILQALWGTVLYHEDAPAADAAVDEPVVEPAIEADAPADESYPLPEEESFGPASDLDDPVPESDWQSSTGPDEEQP